MLKASPTNHLPKVPQAPDGLNWWVFFWGSVVFIIYGSLFPFDFQSEARPMAEFYANWHMFRSIPDASDNFLLFIPLGIGLDACFQGRHRRFFAGPVAWLILGVGIQLIQLYLPTRTAAVSDALWNAVGMVFGVMAFKRVRMVVTHLQHASSAQQDSYAMLLVVIWFCYESFPFVPTLDVGLLRDHIKSVVIAPPFELMRLFQHTLAAMLAGVAMLRANWMQPRWLNVLIPGGLAVFLEIFVAYGSLRRETLMGIIGGLLVGSWIADRTPKKISPFTIGIALMALLITVLTPYRGQAQGSTFTFTPFADIFWKGVTIDVSPSAFEALAIGTLLWSGISLKATARIPRTGWISAVFALLVVLEVFRMYVVGYRGDTTPLAMAVILASFLLSVGRRNPMGVVLPG
ncbi:MAG TPA: VanZ family protein, partial [Rhodoferax sp.]